MFDEMAITFTLDYDTQRDLIDRLQNLGEQGRTSKFAKSVLVFMARGLVRKWKMSFAYSTSNKPVGDILAKLVPRCVTAIQRIGIHVGAVIGDQSTPNRKAARLLGTVRVNLTSM